MLPGGPWVVPGRSPDAPWAAFSAPMAIKTTSTKHKLFCICKDWKSCGATGNRWGGAWGSLAGPCRVLGRSWGSLRGHWGVLATKEPERNFQVSPGQVYQQGSPLLRLIDVRQIVAERTIKPLVCVAQDLKHP